MPPNADDTRHQSTMDFRYPSNRDIPLKTGDYWLDGKRTDDGAEGLWRVHDKIYDVSSFVKDHPGGKMWLELTKGTDVTEAFEAHHLTSIPFEMLKKYYVRDAKTPRNSPFTFEEDGFYKTLKRRVIPILKTVPKKKVKATDVMIDSLVACVFLFAVLANYFSSYTFGTIAGVLLGYTTIAAHNYTHKKDNFRMYYFDLSMMQFREWRITHALSHHLFPNTIIDIEISIIEPLIEYLPKKKSLLLKYGSWVYILVIWTFQFPTAYVKRMVQYVYLNETRHLHLSDLVPFIMPTVMYFVAGQPFLTTLWMWSYVICSGSLWFCFVAFNGAHHHPDIFHDGDAPRSKGKIDWGIHQLDTIVERVEVEGSPLLVLTHFGDHGLHHMFPTLDHGALEYLYPVFNDTMKEFGIDLRMKTALDLVKGQFRQLARETPNPNPPGHK